MLAEKSCAITMETSAVEKNEWVGGWMVGGTKTDFLTLSLTGHAFSEHFEGNHYKKKKKELIKVNITTFARRSTVVHVISLKR